MHNLVAVRVAYSLQYLVCKLFCEIWSQAKARLREPSQQLEQIALHELKNQYGFPILVINHILQLNDVRVAAQEGKCRNFAKNRLVDSNAHQLR